MAPRTLLATLLVAVLAASCGDSTERRGGLLLQVSRDGPLPLDRVDFTITSRERVLHEASYRVPEEAALPTTFGITSNGDTTASVTITVTAWGQNAPLDRRDAIVTQVPNDRVALLKVVLSARCTPQVTLVHGVAVSACGDRNTCDPSSGDCMSAVVDGSVLPSFEPDDSMSAGGATGDDDPSPVGGMPGGGSDTDTRGAAGDAGSTAGGAADAGESAGGAGGTPGIRCEPGFGDCDDDPSDCETVIDGDVNNCGACGKRCPNGNGHAYCEAAVCKQTSCKAPLADCNFDPSDGCEIDTTRSERHCLGCNQACPDDRPFCTPKGCASAREITLVSSDTLAVFDWSDDGRQKLTTKHRLTTPVRDGDQGRLILVAALGNGTDLTKATLLYAGQPMFPGVSSRQAGTNSDAVIYYLVDPDLPARAGEYPIVLSFDPPAIGDVALQVLELNNVNPYGPIATGSNLFHFCNPMDVSFDFDFAGAFTFALAVSGTRDNNQFLGPFLNVEASSGTWRELWDPDAAFEFSRATSSIAYFSDQGTTLHWGSETCKLDTAVTVALTFAPYSSISLD